MRATPGRDPLAAETFAERRRLVGLLETLSPQQWAAPSLCDGWRVREVVAHITMPYRHSTLRVLRGMIAARGRFDVFADRIARADTAALSDTELLASLRRNIEHPWRPPGGGQAGALSHDVIHGLDITEPLGLPAPPPARIAAVLDHAGPRNLKFFGVDLRATRLEATDADVAVGADPGVGDLRRLPVKELLLVVTGRRDLGAAPAGDSAGDSVGDSVGDSAGDSAGGGR